LVPEWRSLGIDKFMSERARQFVRQWRRLRGGLLGEGELDHDKLRANLNKEIDRPTWRPRSLPTDSRLQLRAAG
jgi:hypothetical protein